MTPSNALELLKSSPMQIKLNATLLEMSGVDVMSWLQGQITQDIRLLQPGGHIKSCICSPTGQLEAILSLYSHPGHIAIITEQPEVVISRVENLVIMEDVSILASTQNQIWSIQGKDATGDFPIDRTGFGGSDCLEDPGLPEIPSQLLAALEIAARIPRFGIDTNPKTLPPELGGNFIKAHVSYTKGCYQGQEVLQRIHTRGHTNKSWVTLQSGSSIPLGDVHHDGKSVGKVHRAAEHPELGYIASATLRNSAAEPGAIVRLGDLQATVIATPLLS